jgi:SAM-dependent methyltransferase
MYTTKKQLLDNLVPIGSSVLDVGFAGQGVSIDSPDAPHGILKNIADELYGVDLLLPDGYEDNPRYRQASAEKFDFGRTFDVIVASDIIEHLSNPGLFLDCAKKHLKKDGRLILTTNNAFCMDTLAGKLTRDEPIVNYDHTMYFTPKTLTKLLEKNGWRVASFAYLDASDAYVFKRSLKKKVLIVIEKFLRLFTEKFTGGMVIVAVPSSSRGN